MGRPPPLEAFDAPPPEAARPRPTYADGIAEGREAARAELAQAQGRLRSDVAEAIAAITFTHAEARASLLAALRPLMETVMDRIVPDAARDALPAHVAAAVQQAAAADSAAPLVLRAPPASVPALSDLARRQAGCPLRVEADDSLEAGCVLLEAAAGATLLDADALAEEIRAALSALITPDERLSRHG